MISIAAQEQIQTRLEVIVVDNVCQPDTKRVYDVLSAAHETVQYKFLPLCDNPGYAMGNNKGAALAAPDSKYILFLNDDLILSAPDFIENLALLAEIQARALAVGCKLVTIDGDGLIEAGYIIFNDGSTKGYRYGMKHEDIYRSEYSYPRPVDFVSGCCLLIDRDTFMGYTHNGDTYGFDYHNFPNYYEDTDLQMHIQHDLHKEV